MNLDPLNNLRNHLVGWLVIIGKENERTMQDKIIQGLNAFVGDFGLDKAITASAGFGFGLWKPRRPMPLTSWSFFSDEHSVCFIEGVFYDAYLSHQPLDGEDPFLAELFLNNYRTRAAEAIGECNGSFCGFIYDRRERELVTFVDRLGVKVLYWTSERGRVIVSSNLAALRDLMGLSLDHNAAFQFLTIGFPIDERTLLKNVMVQLPCTINTFKGDTRKTARYWNPPTRLERATLRESAERISVSVEEHVIRIFRRAGDAIGLGMTGGHDSRVVSSALAYKGIPFVPMAWRDFNFNDRVMPALCGALKKTPIIVNTQSNLRWDEVRKDVFVYSDGYYLDSFGFPRLARECHALSIRCLMFGFAGDKMSGSLTIPAPQYMKSIEALAMRTLEYQMELLSFDEAGSLLGTIREDLRRDTVSEWLRSFVREGAHGHLSDVSIWQGFANRNLKRIRYSMTGALQHAQTLFPFLDSKVMEAYFSLPISHLNNQKAHCYAGFHRFASFGDYQATGYPISLREEAVFPHGIYLLRLFRTKMRKATAHFRSAYYKGEWTNAHVSIYHEIAKSPLFDAGVLARKFSHRTIFPRELYKMQTLSRFHDFYVSGNSAHVPQRFFAKEAAGSFA